MIVAQLRGFHQAIRYADELNKTPPEWNSALHDIEEALLRDADVLVRQTTGTDYCEWLTDADDVTAIVAFKAIQFNKED